MLLFNASEITVAIWSEQQPIYDSYILPVKAVLPQSISVLCGKRMNFQRKNL